MAGYQEAKDYDMIVNLFEKYTAHKKTKVLTETGFRKYLLQEQAYPAWLVRSLLQQVKQDMNLAYHIGTLLEHYLIEGMLLGTLKETACKLALKNSFGWEENPVKQLADKGKAVKTIRMVAATKQLPKPAEAV